MEEREAITVRLPAGLLAKAREIKSADESLNDIFVQAVETEIRHRLGMQALNTIARVREQIKERTGVQPDSAALIHTLREGEGRRD